jgi:hypothetical protein
MANNLRNEDENGPLAALPLAIPNDEPSQLDAWSAEPASEDAMFKSLLEKKRQELWLAAASTPREIPTYAWARTPRTHADDGSIEYGPLGAQLNEDPRSWGSHEILLLARAASGL